MDDGRLHFPATARNREAIAEVLEPLLPQRGLVLEIASGSGEHLCHFQQQFAASHPLLRWQGSDPDPLNRCSLQAWPMPWAYRPWLSRWISMQPRCHGLRWIPR